VTSSAAKQSVELNPRALPGDFWAWYVVPLRYDAGLKQGGSAMAMGKRRERQEALFITADELPKSSGHPFYRTLNQLLAEAEFDRWIERRCERYYATEEKRGQPSIPPGVYFRMLLVGYFEGIDSQRGIAWRCADSLSLRQFLGIPVGESTPDTLIAVISQNRLVQRTARGVRLVRRSD
jgi:hypothetical protein